VSTVVGAGAEASAPSRRELYERAQRRRSSLIASISTIVVVVLLVVLIPLAPGWDQVRSSFFNGTKFRESFPKFLSYFWYDVQIFLWCVPAIVTVGLLLAFARNVRSAALYPLRLFATLYIDIVRGVPVILWISLIGFGVPGLFQERAWYTKPILWASVALVMTYSAYVAEVFRAGIESIHESQRAAARSLGLTSGQTMRHVVLPQAVRRVVPPLMNDFVSLQKDVALVSIVGPIEVLRQAGIAKASDFNFTHYVVAAVLFLCVSIPLTRTTDWLLARERRSMSGTAVR
jgi:polar amino acid transport system permease protein